MHRAVVLGFLVGAMTAAAGPEKTVRELVDAHAATLEGADPWWQTRLSPALPAAWPPDGGGRVYLYAYSANHGPQSGLADAERVSAPWARVLVDTTGKSPPALEPLARAITAAGVQGVRPVAAADAERVKRAFAQVEVWSRTHGEPTDAAGVRRDLQRGFEWNSVLADQVRARHAAFFAWLGGAR